MEAENLPYGEMPALTREEEEGRDYLFSVMNNDWDRVDPLSILSPCVDEPIQRLGSDIVTDTCDPKTPQLQDIPHSIFDFMTLDHDLQTPVLDSMHLTYDSHDPVLGPATLEFLESYCATAILPTSASSNTEMEACIYPLDALISLENVNLGPLVQDANHVIDLTGPAKSGPCAVEVDTRNKDASTTPTSVTPAVSDITIESKSPNSSVTSVNTIVEPSATTKKKQGVQPDQAQKEETSKSTPEKDRSKAHKSSAIRSKNQSSPTTPRKLVPAPAMEATVKNLKKSQKTVTPAFTAPIPTNTTPQRAIPIVSTGVEYKTPCKPQKQVITPIMTPLSSVAATPNHTTSSESASISQSGYAASMKTVMQAVLPPTPKSLSLPQGHAPPLHTQSGPTSQYDPSIHKLQTAYEAKQQQAKIEHQNKYRVQKQKPQQKPTNKERLIRIQKEEHLKRLQDRLNTHAMELTMEREQIYRKRDALVRQPAELAIQERKILAEQWKRFKEDCQKHKIEKNHFIQLQQEDQAVSKLEATPQYQTIQRQATPNQATSHQTTQRQATPHQVTQPNVIRHQAISQYQAPSPFQALPQYQAVPEFQVTAESRPQSLQQPQAPVSSRPRQIMNYVSPSTSHTQSISSRSSAAPLKRGFSDMNSPMTNDKVTTNPVDHDQWSVGSSSDFTDLNRPPIKRFKWALK